jgi:hypothetical protein
MTGNINKVFHSIVERIRKGSTDTKGFIQELIDIQVDEQTARILVNSAYEQVKLEKGG